MSPDLPRVLHALAPGPAGGLESVVQMHARGWARQGGAVMVALALDAGIEVPTGFSSLAEAGVAVRHRGLAHRAYVAERRFYRDVIREFRPDVVHCHGYRADLLAGSAARSLGVARVSTVHGFTGGDWKNRLYERLQTRSFRNFGAVIAVASPLVARLTAQGVPARLIHLLQNAWAPAEPPVSRAEARLTLGIEGDAPVLGWVGRFSREKAPALFLDALARLETRAARAVLVGDGAQREALRAQAGRLGLDGRVRFVGLVPQAARTFSAFDALVLSSETEGTPIVLFEAMAAGVPIVATAVGGVPEVVTPETAWLVPPRDPAALAAAIDTVLGDPAAAAGRAGRARQQLEARFALEPWLGRHADIYRALGAPRSEDVA